jgi:hypothetical protein
MNHISGDDGKGPKKVHHGISRHIQSIRDNPRMQSFRYRLFRQPHQFRRQQDSTRGPIPRNSILRRGSPGNQRRGRMLNLHFLQQDQSILGEFGQLSRPTDE